ARKPSASGFVNAVLRNVLRQRDTLPLPPRPDSSSDPERALAYLGITHSHPEWLLERWLRRYGFEQTEAWVRFNNQPPRLTLRANTLRATRAGIAAALGERGIDTEVTPIAPHGLFVTSGN